MNVWWLGKASWGSWSRLAGSRTLVSGRCDPSTGRCDNKLSFVSSLLDSQITQIHRSSQWLPHRHTFRDSCCPSCHGLSMLSLRFMPPPASTPQRYPQPRCTSPHEHSREHNTCLSLVALHSVKQHYSLEDNSRPPPSATETTTLTHSSLCKGSKMKALQRSRQWQ